MATRGQQLAQNVTVAVYVAAGANVPPWPDAAWVALAVNPGDDVADVPPDHGTALFGPFTWSMPLQGPHAIFVTATCTADPATTDPATGWPCATNPVPAALDTRVSCDNNLGLRVVVVQ